MSISADWYDDDHRVWVERLEGDLTWDELNTALGQWKTTAESVPYNIVLLVDMSSIGSVPKGNLLAQGRSSSKFLPNNVNQIVIVIQSRLIEVFAGLVFEMMPKWRNKVKFVKTLEEGQKLVAEAIAKS
jgi:hypothetical protein